MGSTELCGFLLRWLKGLKVLKDLKDLKYKPAIPIVGLRPCFTPPSRRKRRSVVACTTLLFLTYPNWSASHIPSEAIESGRDITLVSTHLIPSAGIPTLVFSLRSNTPAEAPHQTA